MFDVSLFVSVPVMFAAVFALEACIKFVDQPTIVEMKPVRLPTIYEEV